MNRPQKWHKFRNKIVEERDKNTCKICGYIGKNKSELILAHIKDWAYYPELRYDINNVITLCKDCDEAWGDHLQDLHLIKFSFVKNKIKFINQNGNFHIKR